MKVDQFNSDISDANATLMRMQMHMQMYPQMADAASFTSDEEKNCDTDVEMSGCIATEMQSYSDAEPQRCGATEMRSYRDAELQRCGATEMRSYSDAELQRCGAREMRSYRYAELQRCRFNAFENVVEHKCRPRCGGN